MTTTSYLPVTRTSAAATDLLVGVVAGLGAALVMNLFQAGMSRALSKRQSSNTAAVKAANAVAQEVSGASVKPHLKRKADSILHYLTGAVAGVIYGLVAGIAPGLTAGRGLVYGAMVWAVADEALIPALGLAPPPTDTALPEHGFALASHLVFGLSLDFLRRQINRAISVPVLQ